MRMTDEQVGLLRVGQPVTVQTDDYRTRGLYIGLLDDPDGFRIRVLGEDKLERRIPLPANVRV